MPNRSDHLPPTITASEVGEYVFCNLVWWYSIHKYKGSNTAAMQRGTFQHEQLSTQRYELERNTPRKMILAYIVIGVGVLVIAVVLLWSLVHL